MNKAEQIRELKFLKRLAKYGDTELYRLVDTVYLFVMNPSRDYLEWTLMWKETSHDGVMERNIAFSDVFDSVPVEVQEDLAFHFDIFKE